jgi:hypothetical protein
MNIVQQYNSATNCGKDKGKHSTLYSYVNMYRGTIFLYGNYIQSIIYIHFYKILSTLIIKALPIILNKTVY